MFTNSKLLADKIPNDLNIFFLSKTVMALWMPSDERSLKNLSERNEHLASAEAYQT